MRATSLGQAGILIETVHGSIVCDPWFVPAFFGSWFVFPRNDQLGDELHERIRTADYLYVSHLHGDHFDEVWLADERNIRRDVAVLVPGYPSRELDTRLRALGFENQIRTNDGEEHRLGEGESPVGARGVGEDVVNRGIRAVEQRVKTAGHVVSQGIRGGKLTSGLRRPPGAGAPTSSTRGAVTTAAR